MRRRVLVVLETAWERPQLEAARPDWSRGYEVLFASPSDADCPWDFDAVRYIDEEARARAGKVEGIFSWSDYPGATVAAAIAERLGLPGPGPLAVLGASHKYLSRLRQREATPEAVPAFALVDPDDPSTFSPPLGFPCFLKPVKGAFSIMSGVVASQEDMTAFLGAPEAREFLSVFLGIFHQLSAHFGLSHDGRFFLAEELLKGRHATVEGWSSARSSGILGIVDSSFYPGTCSFERFDYPSSLPRQVQQRMEQVALRVAAHLGLESTLFNIEMVWDPESDRVAIIEVNPRGCGQFADLYHKVDGRSGVEVALAVAAGKEPPAKRGGASRVAASFPLRVFQPTRVRYAPDAERVAGVCSELPGALVWTECSSGDELLDFRKLEDGQSSRYAVVNLGGRDAADLAARLERARERLGFVFEDLDPLTPVRLQGKA